jgi:hypothetical protein
MGTGLLFPPGVKKMTTDLDLLPRWSYVSIPQYVFVVVLN